LISLRATHTPPVSEAPLGVGSSVVRVVGALSGFPVE
jgi:hypothetical protein